jgi:hypothetical protein
LRWHSASRQKSPRLLGRFDPRDPQMQPRRNQAGPGSAFVSGYHSAASSKKRSYLRLLMRPYAAAASKGCLIR